MDTAYPLGIDPFDVVRHLRDNKYSLDTDYACRTCGSDNHFFYISCYECDSVLEPRSSDSTDEFDDWSRRSSGFLSVLEHARRLANEDQYLDAKE